MGLMIKISFLIPDAAAIFLCAIQQSRSILDVLLCLGGQIGDMGQIRFRVSMLSPGSACSLNFTLMRVNPSEHRDPSILSFVIVCS